MLDTIGYDYILHFSMWKLANQLLFISIYVILLINFFIGFIWVMNQNLHILMKQHIIFTFNTLIGTDMDEAVDVIEEWNGLSEKDLLNGSEGLLLQVKDKASLLGEQAVQPPRA